MLRAPSAPLQVRSSAGAGAACPDPADGRGHVGQVSKQPLFKKSGAKTFIYAGPWALAPTQPEAQHNKVFLLLFVHKK
jgi:hypothetical protein